MKTPSSQLEIADGNRERLRKEHANGIRIVPFVKEVFKRFGEDNASLIAAALSFYTLLSLVPLLLVAFGIAGMFLLKSADAQRFVLYKLIGFLPAISKPPLMNQVIDFLKEITTVPKGSFISFGALGLLWSASAVFLNMETGLNAILGVTQKRNFLKSRLTAFFAMTLIGTLFLGSVVAGNIAKLLSLPKLLDFTGIVISLALTVGMFFIIYKVIPNAKIRTKAALIGAVVAALFFEIVKRAFGFYISNFGGNKISGTMGIIIFLITWILYSFSLLMLGSEVADVYSDAILGEPVVKEQ